MTDKARHDEARRGEAGSGTARQREAKNLQHLTVEIIGSGPYSQSRFIQPYPGCILYGKVRK